MRFGRGMIYYVDLSPVMGAEEGGIRPAVIVSNDLINRYSPHVTVLPMTSKSGCADAPTRVAVPAEVPGLSRDLTVLAEQVRTVDKRRLKECLGKLDAETVRKVDAALCTALGLPDRPSDGGAE